MAKYRSGYGGRSHNSGKRKAEGGADYDGSEKAWKATGSLHNASKLNPKGMTKAKSISSGSPSRHMW